MSKKELVMIKVKNQTTLSRAVNGRIRYYKVSVYKTLFGDYVLEKEYGGIKNKKPTGIIKEYITDKTLVFSKAAETIKSKMKRGYTFA